MKIIITETQKKIILSENIVSGINSKIKDMNSFTKNILSLTKKQIDLDFKTILPWGATIGGFISPIAKYIENKNPKLSNEDIAIISVGIILTYYNKNNKKLLKVLELIKEKKLIKEFDYALGIADIVKNKFLNFIESLNIKMSSISNIIAYSFLIPILPDLYILSNENSQNVNTKIIVDKIINHGLVPVEYDLIEELINKLVKRFES